MGYILKNSWALLLGMFLLMLGNGLQGTLLGVRGAIEGFSPTTMSWVMSAYFLGILIGSRTTPYMIRRVGHVRVFAALASLISAAFIVYAMLPDPYVWSAMRLLVGFSFAGVYVVAESWLNDSATNETRGQALSAYMIVMMLGLIMAQVLLNAADPAGFILFAAMSVLVSVSFAPILLSVSPAPVFHSSKPMSIKKLYKTSPLGVVGIFLMGGVFSIMFGMSPVYATSVGMNITEVSIFVGAIYVGGVTLQYPIGWVSDRMDRRLLIILITAFGAIVIAAGSFWTDSFFVLVALSFFLGGSANPLYSLLIAHTNDYLDPEDMANAAGGMIFVNSVGAVGTPILIGLAMTRYGPNMYFYLSAVLLASVATYGAYRMTRREAIPVDDTMSYTPIMPQSTTIVAELAQEIAIDQYNEEEAEKEGDESNESA